MNKTFALIFLLFLSACGGGTSPGPGPNPTPTNPSSLVFEADWNAPLGQSLVCGGPGHVHPFSCSLPPGAVWGLLPDEQGGSPCAGPLPNVCYQLGTGKLGYTSNVIPAFALINANSVPRLKPISVEAEVTATNDCTAPVAFVGPVIYDGEGAGEGDTGKYYALYLNCWTLTGDRNVYAWVYSGIYAGATNGTIYAPGSTHKLRIDYLPGISVTYKVDDIVVMVETPGSLTPGLIMFDQDPHPALWFGNSVGSIGPFKVYSGP